MLYRVTNSIEFAYGHRLLNHSGKCRNLHGHNGVLEFDIDSYQLNDLGMVIDFGEARTLVKEWIDDNLDHRMLLDRRDPLVPVLSDMGESLYLFDKNPTAENIAEHIYHQITKNSFNLSEVRLWETSTNCATYRKI